MFGKIKKFFSEVVSELKKVSWSTKQELIDATWIVIISSGLVGIFIWLIDSVLAKFLQVLIR